MTRHLRLAAWLGAATLILAACGGGTATTAPVAPATAAPPAAPTTEPAASDAPATTVAPASAVAGCEVVEGDATTTAEIAGFGYPAGLVVNAGESITWTNRDRAPHTVTFDDGSCSSGSIAAGASATVRYDVPGTYPFHCAVHPTMAGSLEVQG
jgi:plastocyanin